MAVVLIIFSNYCHILPIVNAIFDKIGLIAVVQKKSHYHISVITLWIPERVNMYLRSKDVITCTSGGVLVGFYMFQPH